MPRIASAQNGLSLRPDCGVVGIDEAGRGPLAGPVVAAAVILDPRYYIAGLDDSKRLSEARRETLAPQIQAHALCWAVAWSDAAEIDALNILQATMLAMRRALAGLHIQARYALVDGDRFPRIPCPGEALVGGDALEPCISAASILAKVRRDRMLRTLDGHFPEYGFAAHKGYPTPAHLQALQRLGPCPQHRRSFAPVREACR